jgi:hypothetical protein
MVAAQGDSAFSAPGKRLRKCFDGDSLIEKYVPGDCNVL